MNTIRRREISGYFHTAAGYVFIGVFLAVSSVLFYMQILRQRSGDLPRFIAEMSYLWMLLSPVLTMRLLAEEKQKKTDQLLLTSPVSLPGIVIGKYLAAVTVLLATAGMTLMYVLVVALYGTVYPAELAVNYTGFILQGCAFAALDLYISGCASTPVTAAAAAFVIASRIASFVAAPFSSSVALPGVHSPRCVRLVHRLPASATHPYSQFLEEM